MARRIRPETAVQVVGVRGVQAAKFRADLEKLPTVTDIYDFGPQRALLEKRIAVLVAGEDVDVQAGELADELVAVVGLKSRFDMSGPRCFRTTGDSLEPVDYERIAWSA